MTKYKIYAGLGGGFGGANYQGIHEFTAEYEAIDYAYELAFEEYQSYEGYHGLLDREQCREDLWDSFGQEPTEEDVDDRYQEEVESWIEYYVRPATSEHDVDDE